MEDIKIIIENILKGNDLISENEAFLSEADFHLNFARCLDKIIDGNKVDKIIDGNKVILEYPFYSNEIYDETGQGDCYFEYKACKNCTKNCQNTDECTNTIKSKDNISKFKDKINNDKTYCDIKFKYNETDYFVELKYKTKALNIKRHGKDFRLKEQGGNDLGRYAVYEDIERIGKIVKNKEGRKGFVIVITNDKSYWKENDNGVSRNFLLNNNEINQPCKKNDNNCSNCWYVGKKEDCNYLGYFNSDADIRPLSICNENVNIGCDEWKDWKVPDANNELSLYDKETFNEDKRAEFEMNKQLFRYLIISISK